jgi:hypothetical protein
MLPGLSPALDLSRPRSTLQEKASTRRGGYVGEGAWLSQIVDPAHGATRQPGVDSQNDVIPRPDTTYPTLKYRS